MQKISINLLMTCVVSAYYKIPSKKPHDWYMPHLVRWFRSVGTSSNVHFFTTDDVKSEISTQVSTDNVSFHILPFASFVALSLGRDFWDRQFMRDPERYHSPELGMIWFEKQWFVDRAMQIDPSSVFVWCDAGCVRDDQTEQVAKLFGRRGVSMDDGKIHLQQVAHLGNMRFYKYPDTAIAGAIMIGNRAAWKRFNAHYMRSLHAYDAAGIPAISDQYVIARCVHHHPTDYVLHAPAVSISNWFSFLEMF